ncbi:hypothetical protein [Nitrosospira multiformis]|uniref:hypothetical protein n=1 Tax=Nitrosospira multiformis TaxID=1231 RepID=UPI000942EB91|nr:hypothetical protein [Nitrosospira multiformis]
MISSLVDRDRAQQLEVHYEEDINTEMDLIMLLRTSQQVYEAGGRKFLTYSFSKSVMVPAGEGSVENTKSCQTTFEVEKGIVVGST